MQCKKTLNEASPALPVLALLFSALVWGLAWWPFRYLYTLGLHPLYTTALIYGLGTLYVVLFKASAFKVLLKTPLLWMLLIFAGLTNIGFNWAVTMGDVVRAVLLFYLMPLWSILLAYPILGVAPSKAAMARLVLALAGVTLVLKVPQSAWPIPRTLTDYLAISAGICFAINNLLLLKGRDLDVNARTLAIFLGDMLTAASIALVLQHSHAIAAVPPLAPSWVWIVLILGALFFLSNQALQYGVARLHAHTTSLIMLSEIIFATVSSVLLGASVLNWRIVLGAILIVSAAFLAMLENDDK